MAKGDAFYRKLEQQAALEKAEAEGRVADSMEVRAELIRRMDSGEMTLQEVQNELKKIKRNAKRNGKVTRTQAYMGK